MVSFPPEGKRALLKWYLSPYFPTKVLGLHYRNGRYEEYYDEEIEYVHRGRNKCILKLRGPWGNKTIVATGGDPFERARLSSPWKLFLSYCMKWLIGWYSVIYFLFLFPVSLGVNLLKNWWLIVLLVSLGIYFITTIRYLRRPSIEIIELHEYGQYAGLRDFVPGPEGQSKMTLEQVMKYVGLSFSKGFNDEALKEMAEDLERLSEENKRLWIALARAEESASKIYETALADVLLTAPKDLVERIREQLIKEMGIKQRLYLVLLIILPALAFALGFLLAGGGIAIAPP